MTWFVLPRLSKLGVRTPENRYLRSVSSVWWMVGCFLSWVSSVRVLTVAVESTLQEYNPVVLSRIS